MMQDNHVYFQFYFKSWKPNVITKQDFMWRQVTPSSAPAGSGTPPWPWPPWLVWPRGQSSWRSTSSWYVLGGWLLDSRVSSDGSMSLLVHLLHVTGGDTVLDEPAEVLLVSLLVLLLEA